MTKQDSDRTSIALINQNIGYITKSIDEVKIGLKELSNSFIQSYASKLELADVAKETENRLTTLEEKKNLWKYINPIVVAVTSSSLTFLLISYLQKVSK